MHKITQPTVVRVQTKWISSGVGRYKTDAPIYILLYPDGPFIYSYRLEGFPNTNGKRFGFANNAMSDLTPFFLFKRFKAEPVNAYIDIASVKINGEHKTLWYDAKAWKENELVRLVESGKI